MHQQTAVRTAILTALSQFGDNIPLFIAKISFSPSSSRSIFASSAIPRTQSEEDEDDGAAEEVDEEDKEGEREKERVSE